MNSTSALILSVLLAAAVGAATALLIGPSRPGVASGEEPSLDSLAQLRQTLGRLEEKQEELGLALDQLRSRMESQVERRLARPTPRSTDLPAEARTEQPEDVETVAAAGPPSGLAGLGAEEIVQRLLDPDGSYEDWSKMWQEIREAGRTDEVLAAFEARVEQDPYNPDKRVELGNAYLEKITEVGAGPLAGEWANKADASFDEALKLDENNWDARSQKAIALSFWPPIFGKQAEAIQQFEILVKQQETMSLTERHSQTYLLLGNLYQQSGNIEKALEAWNKGLLRFPDNAGLVKKIRAAK